MSGFSKVAQSDKTSSPSHTLSSSPFCRHVPMTLTIGPRTICNFIISSDSPHMERNMEHADMASFLTTWTGSWQPIDSMPAMTSR